MPPVLPYPVFIDSHVIGGFGRGSSDLGIPTANIPPSDFLASGIPKGQTGIYFGFAKISGTYGTLVRHPSPEDDASKPPSTEIVQTEKPILPADGVVLPMVMSVGWNPFYGNSEPSAEVHIVHKFVDQFYGADIKLAVLGYIRPEKNFESVDALIEEIMTDIRKSKEYLAEDGFKLIESSEFFK
ncbi:riboflavin kinase-domain-containing protein [Lipomyces tetrasporus]|uniref:Riboflavin kinase n=1 Tax=Lipomyces tetrasporus TaxID=54092 RepID=A0AAD7VQ24_9ASCO|nr:riboflavin kinase-domain-containing protein [Lipomyces tetrasporus]KAJ8096700.1 riboflavin kinase-domain-containing protein [Lipomyces tetrasporus]